MTLTQITKAGLDNIALDHVFTIGASGTDHYTFQGEGLNGTVNDPTLYLTRGKTYRFENGTGSHAIRIQSADDGTSGTLYNTGVTNNNSTGTVIVEVQHDAPDVLYYQCASHANMKGTIYITGALADGTVTTAKLASSVNSAITANTAKTSNATHTGDVTGSTSLTIASGAVTTAKIASGAVTSTQIADTTIVAGDIADATITLAKLEHGTGSNDGKFLRANNGADPTFETVTGTTINNNADNRVITGSGTANTLNAATSLTFDGSHLSIGAGHLKLASGYGIDFSAFGHHAGMTSELLDDYEEGTFTPYPVNGWGILYGSATTAGAAADVAQGKYVKIGATVYVFFTFKEGNSSGASFQGTKILFYGMPFQSEGQYGTGSDVEAHPLNGFGNSLGSNGIGLFFRPDSSGSTVGGCHYQTSSGQADFTGQHLTNTGQIWFHGTYKVHP